MSRTERHECGFVCHGGTDDTPESNRQIARVFAVGDHIEIPLYDPDLKPNEDGQILPRRVMVLSPSKATLLAHIIAHAVATHVQLSEST